MGYDHSNYKKHAFSCGSSNYKKHAFSCEEAVNKKACFFIGGVL